MRSNAMKAMPYLIHTNRELGLMLSDVKPLAVFAEEYEHTPECLRRYLRMFDRHVDAGRFVRREHPAAASPFKFRYVLYTLPAEEWRIERMIRLKELPGVWTAEREREEGELLGYEDWMNDLWLERYSKVAKRDA